MANPKRTLTASNIKYLLVMKELYDDNQGVRSTDLAKSLSITKPSVHTMVKALQSMGFVKKDRCGVVWFTQIGKALTMRYCVYFETICNQLSSILPSNSDVRSAVYAMIAELGEEDIRAMCNNIAAESVINQVS